MPLTVALQTPRLQQQKKEKVVTNQLEEEL